MWKMVYKHFSDMCKLHALKKCRKQDNLVFTIFVYQSPEVYPTLVGTF